MCVCVCVCVCVCTVGTRHEAAIDVAWCYILVCARVCLIPSFCLCLSVSLSLSLSLSLSASLSACLLSLFVCLFVFVFTGSIRKGAKEPASGAEGVCF